MTTPSTPPVLLVEQRPDGVARLTLNRPERRNALNRALVEALLDALHSLSEDPSVRVIVLSGSGRDFCSGADLAELEAVAERGVEASLEDASHLGALFVAMRAHRCPVVAVVHGRALAGGAGLAASCDLVLAREDAELGFPEVHLGFVPAMVMTILRRKIGESRAFELSVRGDRISALEAAQWGLVNRTFPVEGFEDAALAWISDLARRPASAVSLTKRLLYGLDALSFEAGIARGAEVNVIARQTEACRAGVQAFLSRTPKEGAS